MTVYSRVADYVWLTGDEASAILDDLATEELPLHTALARLRGKVTAERARGIIEQVTLRRLATAKFRQAQRMFFTRIGLEQATDEWVAAYKASRLCLKPGTSLPSTQEVADLCCGIAGDLMQIAAQHPAFGVDRDPIAAHFASCNSGTRVKESDVADVDVGSVVAWHIDPDRRPSGHRTTSLVHSQPSLETIGGLLARNANAAIKLAPATKLLDHWAERCEFEWISRDRECRQLVAWHGELAHTPGRRRATIVARDEGVALRSVAGEPNQPVSIAKSPERFIFDIDAAVLAAHLKGALAAEFELSALSAGPTYLTGPLQVTDAALSCFEITDVMPFDKRRLAQNLHHLGIGTLEIKKRGVDLDLELLRRQLKLRGDNLATLLITPIAGKTTAILARRV